MRDVIYHDRPRESKKTKTIKWVAGIVVALLILLGCVNLFSRLDLDMRLEAIESLKARVIEAAVQCYAIEGSYPASIDYLTLNYGVRYDGSRYEVNLIFTAPDTLPEVQIKLK